MASKKETDDSVVVAAAKAIGSAAGKVASLVGVTGEGAKTAKAGKGKLPPKNKARLPRREKKAKKTAAAKKAK